jgi:phage-related protein
MSLSTPVQAPSECQVKLHKAVIRFLNKLPAQASAKSMACIKTLSELGLTREFTQLRHIEGNLWELKVDAENVKFMRYLFVARNGEFFFTNAFKKQTNETPRRDITLALHRATE